MSFQLTDAHLEVLLDQIPTLAGQPRQLVELSGGLTNRNVKVITPAGTYVARCTGTTPNLLEIDRDQEYFNTKAAEAAGVGAPVIDYRPDLGIMLLQYLSGNTLRNNDFQRAGVVRKVAEACRRLHSGPRFRGRFDMFERQAGYLKTVQDNRFRMPSDYLDYQDKFRDVEKVLTAIDNADRAETVDRALVPCNNDLLAGNFVEDGDKVWMIDYEYSGNNDPCFELGNVWSECGLSSDQLDELVTAYYGRRLRHKIARARLQGIVAKYGWTLWGCIQNGSSSLEFDFWGWAMERYEAAVAEFNSPHFARLLDEAQTAD